MSRSHIHAQHFLSGPRLVAELVGHSNIRKNDIVYDLGAGSGVISSVLARRCAQVIAVEIEPSALTKLQKNMTGVTNVTILKQNILDITPPKTPYKIFSNIPFHLSAQIVRKFTETEYPPRAMYLITQKQFARKLVPGNDHFTAQLGAQLGPRFSARIRKPLRRTDFTPPPAVDTVLLELRLRVEPLIDSADFAEYREFVGRCFAEQKFFGRTPRAACKIAETLAPSQLMLEQWVRLFEKTRK